MSTKVGRNEPCPCGSGRKFKHCHGRSAASGTPSAPHDSHAGAVERVLAWLSQRHRKAMTTALDELLFEDFWPEDGPEPEEVDEQTWGMVFMNLHEWLLADGDIRVAGEWRDINDYVLGERGPALSPLQRDFIRQLATNPLKLYTVTEIRPDEGLTLVDAMDADSEPFFVRERAGTRGARAGLLLGCRVVTVDDHLELSGAIYPFSMLNEPLVLESVRQAMDADMHPEDRAYEVARAIVCEWMEQMLMPPRLPELVDAQTGEPLLFVTDHYRILDKPALIDALDASPETSADAEGQWTRASLEAEGTSRLLAGIQIGSAQDRIEIFHRTQDSADEGRAWFEKLAGDSVRHLTREITDPAEVLRSKKATGQETQADAGPAPAGVLDLPPEVLSQAIEQTLRRSYANWADEPIPALTGKTPRQAIRTAAGLERVKGLLRSYEANETAMATSDGRPAISYQFLWDALGIER
ncbi:MAG TPA: SEC-C domain-containing protein [Burkholderiaceae bacterium]|nr:SEC-C domain-containing protein [Burkholderiaceae bacterium]